MNDAPNANRRFQFRLLTLAKALTAFCVLAALAQFAAGRFVYGWMMWIVLLSALHFAVMCGLTWTGRRMLSLVRVDRSAST